MKRFRIACAALLILSLAAVVANARAVPASVLSKKFAFGAWMAGNAAKDEQEWRSYFQKFRESGISNLYVNAKKAQLEQLAAWARPYHIKIHAWVWVLNHPGDAIAAQHPDWYAVNRLGKNSYDYRAYVDYYQWLSPFSPGAREHIKESIREVASAKGIESVHLDYVRYVDVILGADLQPKYSLVQDRQMPEYDYDYHPLAREGFRKIFGADPMEMEHPELSMEWLQYRLNAVTSLVNEIAEIVHGQHKKLTAAVFPFPEMARQMVRQDWPSWNLDAALPMLYQNFYRQNLEWIKFATEQGVREARGRFDIVPGLYLPGLSEDELEKAIRLAQDGGAAGVSLFGINPERMKCLEVVKKLRSEWR